MTPPRPVANIAGEIARKLTKAQRDVVLTDWRGFHPDHHGKWRCKTAPTASRMFAMGLIEREDTLSPPTPLGLAVREILTKEPDHGQ